MQESIQKFLIEDNLDPKKVSSNWEIIKNETVAIYKASLGLTGEIDLSQDVTPTIEWAASPLNQPPAFPIWFLSAYPDVVKYFSNLEDEDMKAVFGELDETALDDEGSLKMQVLRSIVNDFKVKHKLECA